MNIQKYSFLLPLVLVFGLNNASMAGDMMRVSLISSVEAPNKCDLPAPDNFHISAVAPSSIWVAWDPQPQLPSQYNIKVFEESTGNLILDENIPSTLVARGIHNLQPNTEYRIRNTPVCADGTLSTYFVESIGTTWITDLVVSGFSPSTLDASCGVSGPGQYCDFNPAEGSVVTFKIRPAGNKAAGRVFGAYRAINNCNSTKIKILSEPISPYQLYCNSSSTATCTGTQIVIQDQEDQIARFTVQNLINGGFRLLCLEMATNNGNPLYEIVRLGPSAGAPDPSGGQCATQSSSRPSMAVSRELNEEGARSDLSLSATPNPFTDQLDIQIPSALQNEKTEISLYDLQGRRVITIQAAANQSNIQLSTLDLAPGMYFLRVGSGGKAQTVKVVKM